MMGKEVGRMGKGGREDGEEVERIGRELGRIGKGVSHRKGVGRAKQEVGVKGYGRRGKGYWKIHRKAKGRG